jgi:hypothetical protein
MQYFVLEFKIILIVIPFSSGFVIKGIIHFEKKKSPIKEFLSKMLIDGNCKI